jgi:hypothetical protein
MGTQIQKQKSRLNGDGFFVWEEEERNLRVRECQIAIFTRKQF